MDTAQTLPPLGVGSIDASALHEALSRGDDPQAAVDAARIVAEPPVDLDGKSHAALLRIAKDENVTVAGNAKSEEVAREILRARHGDKYVDDIDIATGALPEPEPAPPPVPGETAPVADTGDGA